MKPHNNPAEFILEATGAGIPKSLDTPQESVDNQDQQQEPPDHEQGHKDDNYYVDAYKNSDFFAETEKALTEGIYPAKVVSQSVGVALFETLTFSFSLSAAGRGREEREVGQVQGKADGPLCQHLLGPVQGGDAAQLPGLLAQTGRVLAKGDSALGAGHLHGHLLPPAQRHSARQLPARCPSLLLSPGVQPAGHSYVHRQR
jgi:hypothetical protein